MAALPEPEASSPKSGTYANEVTLLLWPDSDALPTAKLPPAPSNQSLATSSTPPETSTPLSGRSDSERTP